MKTKKIIVQISEGLGNQLFMFAHGFSFSKKNYYDIEIDNISSYKQKKNLLRSHQIYLLDCLNLDVPIVKNDFLINNRFYIILRKIFLIINFFKKKKYFYVEPQIKVNGKKIVDNRSLSSSINFSNKIYVSGNFENQDYFKDYRNELIKKFTVKNKFLDLKSRFINELKNSNSVSIHIRRNKFSDQLGFQNNDLLDKSINFTNNSIDYINKGIHYFNKKVANPKFFIWTNEIKGIEEFTKRLNTSSFTIIKTNDVLNDFYLFKFSKHFIVSPSTFHWWGAWLNDNNNKICLRPSNINPSNNLNFWPREWVSI